MCDMTIASGYTTYSRREEQMSGEAISQENSFAFTEPIDGPPEPWMDDILNEDIMSSLPLNWDNVLDSCLDLEPAQATHSAIIPASSTDAHDSLLGSPSILGDNDFHNDSTNFNLFDPNPTMPNVHPNFLVHSSTEPSNNSSFAMNSFEQPNMPSSEPTSIGQDGDQSQMMFNQVATAFKDLARARAAADPRRLSRKQKQRDASIALYLERIRDTCNEAVAVLGASDESDAVPNSPMDLASACANFDFDQIPMYWQQGSTSGNSFSSGYDGKVLSGSSSPSGSFTETSSRSRSSQPSTSSSNASPQQQPPFPAAATGGVELVMDLNMNTATSLPRKHRPRTQAQRQRYLAVRSQGACEKHKKQHKRCTCIDKTVSATSFQQKRSDQFAVHTGHHSSISPSHVALSRSAPNRKTNDFLLSNRPGPSKSCTSSLPPLSSAGYDSYENRRLSTRLESNRKPKIDQGFLASCSKFSSNSDRLLHSSDCSPTRQSTSDIYGIIPGEDTLRDLRYNFSSHDPLKSGHGPVDQTPRLQTTPRTRRYITSWSESRLKPGQSQNQQLQQCDPPNPAYGTTQQATNPSHSKVSVDQKIQVQVQPPQNRNVPGDDQQSMYHFSSVYYGFRWTSYVFDSLHQGRKIGYQRHTFTAWCLVWLVLLVLSNVVKGLF